MWGEPIRPGPDGRGIPKVEKISYRSLEPDKSWTEGEAWEVTYPDRYEWDCCKQTEDKWFDTWAEAFAWAFNRGWEK